MTPAEFDVCLSRLFDGELSTEEFSSLEQHLTSNAEARRQYLDYVDLHNILELELSAQVVPGTRNQGFVPLSRVLKQQRLRIMRISAMAAAALFIVGILVFALITSEKPELMADFRLAPGTVFSVSHPEGSAVESTILTEGSRMVLEQGTVELTLPTGVRAIVKAPAEIEYTSEDLIRLDSGTGWFQVPSGASGFQVRTGELLVTDLGTEFGIISSLGSPDEAHLLKGKISVRNLTADTAERILKGTGALKAADGTALEKIKVRPEDFEKSLPSMPPYLHLTFDSEEEGRFVVEGTASETSQIHAEMVSGKPEIIPGISGGSLRLEGDGSYIQTDWPGISGAWPRSVACWVRMDTHNLQTNGLIPGIAGWGVGRGKNSKWKVAAGMPRGDSELISRVSFGQYWYDGAAVLKDDTWHHLVFVYRGRLLANGLPDVSIYVDGRESGLLYKGGGSVEIESGKIDTETDTVHSQPLLIGKSPGERDTFKGDIDELYIFTGALQEDAILDLYEAGRSD
ncbi:MAG: LamG-like jellyroll fold domain-containing protein [Luteolibacter sp.]